MTNGGNLLGFGVNTTYTRLYMFPLDGTALYLANSDNASSVAGQATTNGVLAIAERLAYKNGVHIATLGGWSKTGLEIFLGARNNNTGADSFVAAYIQAYMVWDQQLSGSEIVTATALVNAL